MYKLSENKIFILTQMYTCNISKMFLTYGYILLFISIVPGTIHSYTLATLYSIVLCHLVCWYVSSIKALTSIIGRQWVYHFGSHCLDYSMVWDMLKLDCTIQSYQPCLLYHHKTLSHLFMWCFCWHTETHLYYHIWVRSRRCGCLATWFCYHLIAKPGNKRTSPSWPDPYSKWDW